MSAAGWKPPPSACPPDTDAARVACPPDTDAARLLRRGDGDDRRDGGGRPALSAAEEPYGVAAEELGAGRTGQELRAPHQRPDGRLPERVGKSEPSITRSSPIVSTSSRSARSSNTTESTLKRST
nr:hypothetical protein GCM10020093_071640 [Planobispora longispora]